MERQSIEPRKLRGEKTTLCKKKKAGKTRLFTGRILFGGAKHIILGGDREYIITINERNQPSDRDKLKCTLGGSVRAQKRAKGRSLANKKGPLKDAEPDNIE